MSKEQTEIEKAKNFVFAKGIDGAMSLIEKHIGIHKALPDIGDDDYLHIYKQETQSEKGCPFDEEAFNPDLKPGEFGFAVQEIVPESEHWETGYWKIPKGEKLEIIDVEGFEYLIEYIDAQFYVEKSLITRNPFPHQKESVEEAYDEIKIDCRNCGGIGYKIEVRGTCCQRPDNLGECCGIPDPEQYQEACPFCIQGKEYFVNKIQLQSKISQLEADKKELVEALDISEEVSQNFYNTLVMLERKTEVCVKDRKEYCNQSKTYFKSLIQKHTK